MRIHEKALSAAIFSLAGASVAQAADPISYETSAQMQMPIYGSEVGTDWDGFYAGLYGVTQASADNDAQFGLGVALGVNATFDFYLVGAEVAFEGLSGGEAGDETSYTQLLARGGLVVADNVIVYGAAGYGIDTGPNDESDWLVGAGLEYAISDDVSLRAQYLHGFPTSGSNDKNQFTFGANFHF